MNKIIKLLLVLSGLPFYSSQVFSFDTDDVFSCHDSVSNSTYLITILDVGNSEAEMNVTTPAGVYYYNKNKIIYDESEKGSIFSILDKKPKKGEKQKVLGEITIPQDVQHYLRFSGTFADSGDSRNLDCHFSKYSSLKLN